MRRKKLSDSFVRIGDDAFPYDEQESEEIFKVLDNRAHSVLDGLTSGLDLSEEEKREVIVDAHARLIDRMENKFLPEYIEAQEDKFRRYKRASTAKAVSAIGTGVLTAVYIGLSVATGGSFNIAMSALWGVSTIFHAIECGIAKKKAKLLPAKTAEVAASWVMGRMNPYNVVDFYLYNDLQPQISPFPPCVVEKIINNREDKDEIKNPYDRERYDEIVRGFHARLNDKTEQES